jgi:coenzyme F420-reducing hydrogenase alpha subunit
MARRTIRVGSLARVEGEGGIEVTVKDGAVTSVKLDIFEPPRFFEALLRGRRFDEAPDITSRICGICPVAYQMSAIHAMEDACGVRVDGQLRALRRLMYCGEWIESHTLHVYMLHAPDFLGYASGIEMAKDHPAIVERGLQLKKVGNEVIALMGGRSVHPINAKLGGFYRLPTSDELSALAERLRWARDAALATVHWTATLPIPDYERDYMFVALSHPDEYPFNEGRIVSNHGLDIAPREYDDHFAESQVPHSTALHSAMVGRGAYAVGPLARYSLNFDRLSPIAQDAARQAGLGLVCRNPFQSIVVRSVEILYACDEALRIIDQYQPPDAPAIEVRPRAGTGYGCTEAPRGLLYHRYRIDDQGTILDAKIVPPTSQNQRTIEDDLRDVVPRYLDLDKDKLTWRCEQTVRNYDPCISCATHFLTVNVTRT